MLPRTLLGAGLVFSGMPLTSAGRVVRLPAESIRSCGDPGHPELRSVRLELSPCSSASRRRWPANRDPVAVDVEIEPPVAFLVATGQHVTRW